MLKLEAAAADLKTQQLIDTPVGAAALAAVAAQCKTTRGGGTLTTQSSLTQTSAGATTSKTTSAASGITSGGSHVLTTATGGSTPQSKAALQAITYDPFFDNCVDSSRTLCADPDVMHFVRKTFSVNAGATLTLKTYNLQGIDGSSADTVLYLIKCDTSACEAGDIVEADDDGNDETSWLPGDPIGLARDSKIVISAPTAGYYVAYVISFDAGSRGTTDFSIVQPGGVNFLSQNTVFSGWQIQGQELRTGDILAAARNPGTPSMSASGYEIYHDSKLLALSTQSRDCINCGRAQFVDDTFYGATQASRTYLARMTVGAALGSPTSARVVVGVYDDGTVTSGAVTEYYRMNVRLAHLRRSTTDGGAWTHAGATDSDQDGLTMEVEEQLGTCDSHTGTGKDVISMFMGCQQARDWVNASVDLYGPERGEPSWTPCTIPAGGTPPADNIPLSQTTCWTPTDTDHDGIADGAEFFAVVASCNGAPSGPFRQTSCTEPNPLTEECGVNDWCTSEPNGVAPLSTPFYDHDPTAYDIYVEADYLKNSVYSGEPANSHQLSAAQLTQLAGMWNADPSSCWDGSTPPGLCAATRDRRYRVNIHAYAGKSWAVGDDRFQEEVIKSGGAGFTRSHLFSRFAGAMRYAHVARYALAWHSHNAQLGEADIFGGTNHQNRSFWWANPAQTPAWARALFSHELGHTFYLKHQHRAPPASQCCADGPSCSTTRETWGCGSNVWTCDTVWPESPAVPTPMAYQYANNYGMLKKGDIPASSTRVEGSQCSQSNLRFSKGLLSVSLVESSLSNKWFPSASLPEWQMRKRAQDLYCYRSMNSCVGGVLTKFSVRKDIVSPFVGPYCDLDANGLATACYFNWQGALGVTDDGWSGVMDITSGRWTSIATDSANDRLSDLDEWSTLIALGRRPLRNEPTHGMCLYGTTFSGGKLDDDYCGWSEPITVSNVIATAPNYPVSGCRVAGDCGGNGPTCTFDTCVVPPQGQPTSCKKEQACSGTASVCTCTKDAQCYSGQCINNLCTAVWGGCSCAVDGDCNDDGEVGACVFNGLTGNKCKGKKAGDTVQPKEGGQPWNVVEAAFFNGSNSRIQLQGGLASRLETLSATYENQFTLYFDFRFDGFAANESVQVLWRSGAFSLIVERGTGDHPTVAASAGGHTALVWSGLQVGRWYRVVWSVSKPTTNNQNQHFLWVRPWDAVTAWYGAGDQAADCVWQPVTWDLGSPGDVWLGHDGGNDASTYFHGWVDNISLNNFVLTPRTPACAQQF